MRPFIIAIFAASAALVLAAQDTQPPAAPPPRQSGEISITINGAPGLPPKYAVPDFLALTNDAETVAAAKTMGEVLWDDLNFEREFYLIPRDTYKSIPPATSIDQVPLDQWKQLGADGLIIGTVRKTADWSRRPGAAGGCRHRALGAGEGIHRHAQEPASLRAHGFGRDPSAAAGAARGRAHQARVHVGSGRRADEGTGGRSRHLEHLHVRLRRRQPDSPDDHTLARYHAGVVARRQDDRVYARTAPASRTSSSSTCTSCATMRSRRTAPPRSRTTCRRGRRTDRSWPLPRTATAIRRSTS